MLNLNRAKKLRAALSYPFLTSPHRVTRTICFSVPVATHAGILRKEMFEYVLLQFAKKLLILKFFTSEFPPRQIIFYVHYMKPAGNSAGTRINFKNGKRIKTIKL